MGFGRTFFKTAAQKLSAVHFSMHVRTTGIHCYGEGFYCRLVKKEILWDHVVLLTQQTPLLAENMTYIDPVVNFYEIPPRFLTTRQFQDRLIYSLVK